MSDKSKKIDKKFVLSDSTINCYNFRLLTSGYQLQDYAVNPIGYYMHEREKGVVVKWVDLAVEGDSITGYPVINMSNERGEKTAEEVVNGFLNAASMGHFVVLDYEMQKLPGTDEEVLTVTKWYNGECSLVDIPGNKNALTQLFDVNNNPLQLQNLKAGKSFSNIVIAKESEQKQGCLLVDVGGVRWVSDDELEVLSNNYKPFGSPGAAVNFPQRLLKSYDELMETNVLQEIHDKDYTLWAVIYEAEFKQQPPKNDLIDQSLFIKYKAERQRLLREPALLCNSLADDRHMDSSFPKELYLTWDEIMQNNLIPSIQDTDYTLYAAIYCGEFGRGALQNSLDSRRINPDRLEKYIAEKKRARLAQLMSMTPDELYQQGLFEELKELDEAAFDKKRSELK